MDISYDSEHFDPRLESRPSALQAAANYSTAPRIPPTPKIGGQEDRRTGGPGGPGGQEDRRTGTGEQEDRRTGGPGSNTPSGSANAIIAHIPAY